MIASELFVFNVFRLNGLLIT